MRRNLGALTGAAAFAALATSPGWSSQEAGSASLVPTHSFSGAFLAARAAESDNDLKSAIAYYDRALSFDPGNKSLRQSLLLALVSEGEFEAALPHAEALKAVPEAERFSRLTLAVDAFRRRDFDAAENWLDLVLESDLDRLITAVMSAWARVGKGEAEAALSDLDAIQGPQWYAVFLRHHSALIALQAGRHDEAMEAFSALAEAPSLGSAAPDTYMRAIETYAGYFTRNGDREKALETLEQAENFVTGRMATVLLRQQIEAGGTPVPLVETPGDGAAEILLNVATALNRGGGEAFVQLYLNLARALRPQSDAILLQLASLAERRNESERAIDHYRGIGQQSPWRRMAELQIGLNLADLDRHDEAVEFLKSGLERDPDDIRAHLALGRVHAARKDFRAAAEVFDAAVGRLPSPQPDDWELYYQRGIAYERLKEWNRAEPNFHKALELNPEQPDVLNYLGYSWVDMGIKLKDGLALIRRAVELRPNNGYIVDSLGWAHYKLGRYEEAVRGLERAVSLRPQDPVLNDHLGDAYWRVGRRLEATYQWAHARDLDPEPDLAAQVEEKLKNGLVDLPRGKVAEAKPEDEVLSDSAQPLAAGNETAAPENDPSSTATETPVGANEMNTTQETPEPASQDAAKPAAAPVATHTVQPGDSLWSIAAERLGKGTRYRELLDLNPALQPDPDFIIPGQAINLPTAGR